ncbi:MAG: Do family serine endopeptidase [bacterium]
MIHKNFSLRFAVALLILGALFGLIITSSFDFTNTTQSAQPYRLSSNIIIGSQEKVPDALLSLQNTSDAFIYIADLVVPTVVSIQSTRIVRSADIERFHDGDDLKDFFRFRFPKEFRQQGSGSGIIVSKEGYILTNVHVVNKAKKLRVILHDNREFEADIIGLDPLTEVAVIKIDADDLPVVKLGDSDQCKVGEWVLAIGNPLELRSTVTAGIISAKERQIDIIRDSYGVESFIQTDAAINPGNSGGALVNLKGEVIGVNTAIATETGYSAGFGFAIPINLAKKIMSDLILKGKVERGYLGIAMQNIDEKKARALHLERPKGVFIDKVLPDGPAQRSGIRAKDVLFKINNEYVYKSNQVQAIIARKNPGEVINLTLLRNGKEIMLNVTLGKKEIIGVEVDQKNKNKDFQYLGLSVENLTREDAAEIGYSGRAGVLITEVERWSPADEAGIREDDLLIEIDDKAIMSKIDLYEVISNLKKGSVSIFTIVREQSEFHVFVEIPNK